MKDEQYATRVADCDLPDMVPIGEIDTADLSYRACRDLWASVFFQGLKAHFEAGLIEEGRPYDRWVASRDFEMIADTLGLDVNDFRAWVAAEWRSPHPGRCLGSLELRGAYTAGAESKRGIKERSNA